MFNLLKKKSKVTNNDKVRNAKSQIATSLGMFSKISNDIDEANEVLMNVIEEDTALIQETQTNIDSAKSEYEGNKALQQKIKSFIKE